MLKPVNEDWGIGQVQSIISNKTVNFENVGKSENIENVKLEKVENE